MDTTTLIDTAVAMVCAGKGILAADESTSTIGKRFDGIDTLSTEATRRAYRELLFTSPGMEQYISGVILYDETLRQCAADGTPFPKLLSDKGVLPGIKVDAGVHDLAGFPGETVTEGLDGLRQRLHEYAGLGACFAKWRAVINVDTATGLPTAGGIEANAHALARYAALCQEAGVVPIVEPEVLMDGSHDIAACEAATAATLASVFAVLRAQRIVLDGIVLKPNMIVSGKDCPVQLGGRRGRSGNDSCFSSSGAGCGAGYRLPLRGTEPADRHGASERDERPRAVAVGTDILLWSRLAGDDAADVVRRRDEGRRGAAGVSAASPTEQCSSVRQLHRRDGEDSRLRATSRLSQPTATNVRPSSFSRV